MNRGDSAESPRADRSFVMALFKLRSKSTKVCADQSFWRISSRVTGVPGCSDRRRFRRISKSRPQLRHGFVQATVKVDKGMRRPKFLANIFPCHGSPGLFRSEAIPPNLQEPTAASSWLCSSYGQSRQRYAPTKVSGEYLPVSRESRAVQIGGDSAESPRADRSFVMALFKLRSKSTKVCADQSFWRISSRVTGVPGCSDRRRFRRISKSRPQLRHGFVQATVKVDKGMRRPKFLANIFPCHGSPGLF